jgi:transposase
MPKLFIGMDVHKKSWTVHINRPVLLQKKITMPVDQHSLQPYAQNHFFDHQVNCCMRRGVVAIGHQEH